MLLARRYDGAWGEGKSDKGKDKSTAQPELTSCDANGVSCCTVLRLNRNAASGGAGRQLLAQGLVAADRNALRIDH